MVMLTRYRHVFRGKENVQLLPDKMREWRWRDKEKSGILHI